MSINVAFCFNDLVKYQATVTSLPRIGDVVKLPGDIAIRVTNVMWSFQERTEDLDDWVEAFVRGHLIEGDPFAIDSLLKRNSEMIAQYLSTKDVAVILHVSPHSARIYMRQMPHVYVGKHLRVADEALAAWLAERAEKPCEYTSEGQSGGAATEASTASRSGNRRSAATVKRRRPSPATSSDKRPTLYTAPRVAQPLKMH